MVETDVIVVGAGPIGIEVAGALRAAGVAYLHFEAGQIGSTIARWPRNTKFFSSPERVAICGLPVQSVDQDMLTGEHYLAYLRSVVETLSLEINAYEPVREVRTSSEGFEVVTEGRARRSFRCRRLILATGDMNRPRLLGIPGEGLPHVTHYFDEPHRYFGQRLLVIGGRNSAIEAAIRCFRAGAKVDITYRQAAFDRDRVNSRLHLEIGILTGKGFVGFHPETLPVRIEPGTVELEGVRTGERRTVEADFVLACTGFACDTSLLEQAGVELKGEDRVPVYRPETMETSVPGLFIAGTLCSGDGRSHREFIGTSHHHTAKIIEAITGRQDARVGTIPSRAYPFTRADIDSPPRGSAAARTENY